MSEKEQGLINRIQEKYQAIGQNPNTHLEGLVWAKPITYWDYIQVDPLLNLQTQRTTLPDEMVFIMYHQINELIFKMILWELEQIAENTQLNVEFFSDRLTRISRYFDMLSESFNIMGDGMEVEQYMKFRTTLTPASGFQSAQYRMIELCSTELINLIDFRFRATIDRNTSYDYAYENLYWQAAGKDYSTGEKTLLLQLFDEKYKESLIRIMKKYNQINLWTKFKSLSKSAQENLKLINAMRHYDYTVNISWVMAHYHAAQKYLESNSESAEATGGSDWKKYMHPRYQRRMFFPHLWTEKEQEEWGISNLEKYKIYGK